MLNFTWVLFDLLLIQTQSFASTILALPGRSLIKVMSMSPCDTCSHLDITPSTTCLSWQCAVPCHVLILAVPGAGLLNCLVSLWDRGSLVRTGQKNIIQWTASWKYCAAPNENMMNSSLQLQLKKKKKKLLKKIMLCISISDKNCPNGLFSLKWTFFSFKWESQQEKNHMARQKFPSLRLSPYQAVLAVHHHTGWRGENLSYSLKKLIKNQKLTRHLNVLMKHRLNNK